MNDTKFKHNLGLLLIVKNEEMIIDEFFKHYIWQGVDHFYVIDNGSTDSTKDIIEKYPTTYYYFPERNQQRAHYNTVYREMRDECRWLIVCDCDEYIYNKEKGKNIGDYLETLDYSRISNVELQWKMFGSSHLEKQPKSIRKSFIYRKEELENRKHIVNTSLTYYIGIHRHYYGLYNHNSVLSPEELALNHYRIMSKEYFDKVKMTRGDADVIGKVRNSEYFKKHDHNDIKCTELKELYSGVIESD